ncbi:MAG: hypothetical protein JWO90_3154 [Solirubrobacterales bacterium]|jgi:hypothetical protein|nr:hypothetical protein [Solirubrobacterales bacterium]
MESGSPRRVTLASGAQFRVLAFTPFAGAAAGLHVCPQCQGPRVIPVHWEPAGAGHWAVLRRCPDCRWHGAGRHGQDELGAYDEELDRGTAAMVRTLREAVAERMTEDVERFLDALGAGHVLPEDF